VTDLLALQGKELGPAEWKTLEIDSVNHMEELTRGEARLKANPEKATAHPLAKGGGTIVPGFVTLANGMAQIHRLLQAEGVTRATELKVSKLRFVAPVQMGQAIRSDASIVSATAVEGGVDLEMDVTIAVEGLVKPAVVVRQTVRCQA
jgi:acyl dehydratase